MTTELVTINDNTQLAQPSVGGGSFGGNSKFFRLKPANIELQQKTSRAEGSEEGKFRNTQTGEHFDELHLVMIFDPTEPRSYYEDKNSFGQPPLCYSNDSITPSERAQVPQSLTCKNCKRGDINWLKWKKTRKTEDLPPCQAHVRIFAVDRTAKVPYRLAIRGKSISNFRQAMEKIAGMAELYNAQHGQYPHLHDFSFKVKSVRKVDNKGVYYVMMFSEVLLINDEDRPKFGELYTRFASQRNEEDSKEEVNEQEEELSTEMSEESASAKPKKEPVTIEAGPQEEITI